MVRGMDSRAHNGRSAVKKQKRKKRREKAQRKSAAKKSAAAKKTAKKCNRQKNAIARKSVGIYVEIYVGAIESVVAT